MACVLNFLTALKKLKQLVWLVLCLPVLGLSVLGVPVLTNASELTEWEQGCHASKYLDCGAIALTYYHGDVVAVNKSKALSYFKKSEKLAQASCKNKDKWACQYLAEMYEIVSEFKKTPDDIKALNIKTVALFESACAEGSGEDCNELGVLYDEGNTNFKKNAEKAIQYYQKSCGLDFSDGCYNLAQFYSQIRYKNDLKAAEFYAKACQFDDMLACTELGMIYMQGRGDIKQDDVKAKTLLTKACDNGDVAGCKALHKLKTVSSEKRALEGTRHTLDSINNAIQGIFSID